MCLSFLSLTSQVSKHDAREREFFGNQILWEMFRENMFTQSLVIWTPYLMVQSSNELSDQDSE